MVNLAGGFTGAVGGALGGSSIPGLGPFGAIGGGLLGGLGGLFGGSGKDQMTEEARRRLLALGGQNLTAAQAGMSDQRGRQLNYLDQLQALSEGRGPSLARELLQDSMKQAEASQASTAAGATGRGVGAGAAYRNAAGTLGSMGQAAQRTGALARAQEQLGAMSMLGQNIAATRGADEFNNQFNVGQTNDMAGLSRRLRLEALMGGGKLAGMGQTSSLGDQIGAGGASLYSLIGGRGQRPGGV